MPPSIAVWRSVRLHGDTKTEKSRRTLALPQNAVTALREHRKWQASSRLSVSGVAVEEIARLAGHASSRTTETIYRHELHPVITTGADVMDKIFTAAEREA